MCGIAAFFARESIPDFSVLDKLFRWTEKRGQDGCGFAWIRNTKNKKREIHLVGKDPGLYSQDNLVKKTIESVVYPNMVIGDVLIFISRAAPETETETDVNRIEQTLQPIIDKENGLVVVHNGAVSNSILQSLKNVADGIPYKFKTDIDSEAIIASYLVHQRNAKSCFEYLSGGFAVIMYDEKKDMLYVVNDFKPIAHAYVKGVGFFLHSDNDCLGEIIHDMTGCSRDGVFLWESWYHHYLEGGSVKEIDLQSGYMRKTKYSPRYIIGNRWDSNNPKEKCEN
jgi:asparagine synthetase B (glutamine-hydrolysing)